MEKIIDAKGKKIGRVATEAAMALMGKDNPDFQPNVVSKVKVTIINPSLADISQKKVEEKEYPKYSGYPGGLKFEKMSKIIEKKGYSEIFQKAVYGMIPANRLRKLRMKNLIIKD